MTDDYINKVSERYIELYQNITRESFIKADLSNIQQRISKVQVWNQLNHIKERKSYTGAMLPNDRLIIGLDWNMAIKT